ncbi:MULTISPECIES: hypothetical protein [Actinomadura]|jgi:hypothetical protein|uniref:Chaplin n=2 Tax=Actinomadura TaxID=1988 RepID=A0A2P4UM58_9ACTN|nr:MULTISPECIES: hypothetical protein [Actinomadura]MXQ65301.1 hypothetical protein [Actinomadura rayongensis]POM26134.1 hypothetical protein BTM25_05220 [Actinomadura rubteroloni]
MFKRAIVSGLVAGAALSAFAVPASASVAGDDPSANSLIPIQTCRDVQVAALIGVPIKNLLATDDESGPCFNNSSVTNQHTQVKAHH